MKKSVLFDALIDPNSSLFPSFRSSAQGKLPADSRLRTLEHVGQRLDELESIVTSYRPSPQHTLSTDCTPVQRKSFGQNYNVELDGNQTAAQHREIEDQRMSTPPISPPSRASIRRPLFQFFWQENSSEQEEDHGDDFECFSDEVDEEIEPSRPSRLQQSVSSLIENIEDERSVFRIFSARKC